MLVNYAITNILDSVIIKYFRNAGVLLSERRVRMPLVGYSDVVRSSKEGDSNPPETFASPSYQPGTVNRSAILPGAPNAHVFELIDRLAEWVIRNHGDMLLDQSNKLHTRYFEQTYVY